MIGAGTYHYEQESEKSLVEDDKYRKKKGYGRELVYLIRCHIPYIEQGKALRIVRETLGWSECQCTCDCPSSQVADSLYFER